MTPQGAVDTVILRAYRRAINEVNNACRCHPESTRSEEEHLQEFLLEPLTKEVVKLLGEENCKALFSRAYDQTYKNFKHLKNWLDVELQTVAREVLNEQKPAS